jgi:hypothetical protein
MIFEREVTHPALVGRIPRSSIARSNGELSPGSSTATRHGEQLAENFGLRLSAIPIFVDIDTLRPPIV